MFLQAQLLLLVRTETTDYVLSKERNPFYGVSRFTGQRASECLVLSRLARQEDRLVVPRYVSEAPTLIECQSSPLSALPVRAQFLFSSSQTQSALIGLLQTLV